MAFPSTARSVAGACLLAAFATAVLPCPARADVVLLKDGKAIEGEIADRGEAYEVKTKYGMLLISKSEVNKIIPRASGGASEVKPDAPAPAPAVNPKPVPADLLPPPAPPGPVPLPPPPPAAPPKSAPASPPKPEPPPAAAQKQTETLIRDIYKAEYAQRTPAKLQALAMKLFHQAAETRDDPAARFVLYREARDLASQAGDPALAVKAVEAMAEAYAIDPAAERLTALLKSELAPRTSESARILATLYLQLADEAITEDQYDVAARAVSRAESAVSSARDAALAAQVRERAKSVQDMQKEAATVAGHLKILEADPADPAANAAAGRYFCFTKRDWEKGLPLMAKGSDAILKALAVKDLAKPAGTADLVTLADAWWNAGEKMSGSAKAACQGRAVHWYGEAAPNATGLTQAKIKTRVDAFEKQQAARGGAGGGATLSAGLVFWLEPGRDPGDGFAELVAKGKPCRNNTKVVVDAGVRAISFNNTCVEYPASDALKQMAAPGSIFAWIKSGSYQHWGGIANRGGTGENADDFGLWVHQGHLQSWFNWPVNSVQLRSKGALPTDRWVHAGVTWNDKAVTFYIDGRQDDVVTHPGPPMRRASVLAVGCNPPGTREYYLGLLGSLMIFNRALLPHEVARLHAAGRARFR
jgi:hypothetical protein